jgi:YidC/Oxa1 family membrane protein insertase
MESLRLVSLVVFCVSLFLLGEKWYSEQTARTPASTIQVGQSADSVPGDVPTATTASATADKPALPVAGIESKAVPGTAVAAATDVVRLETDLMQIEISLLGGDVRRTVLLKHGDTLDPSKPFVLLETGGEHTYVAQTGLLGAGMPNHKTQFLSTVREARLADGQDEVSIELTSPPTDAGVVLTKRYTVRRGEYVIRTTQLVSGLPPSAAAPSAYFQLVRDEKSPAGGSRWVPTYTGIAVYTHADKYQKVGFSDVAKGKATHSKSADDGWIGVVQHYFVSAWFPEPGAKREFFTRSLDGGLFAAGLITTAKAGKDGQWEVNVPLYVGPQEQKNLEALAEGLQLTVDYGWLTVIATPLFWLLSNIHTWVVQNWGVTIILLTILIKGIFFPLSAASYKSMAKMRVMAPKLQKLKEIHGDDRQKLHQAMMELYKTEKINPLGGCLPIVIQIPVFISLYWVLLGSVEMRQAPFALWIKDLSSPDPFYILPVLMGISMVIQSRLNPEPPDPIQAKVMKIMPVAFSVFFFFFPAGLVLYWLVNNILSIGQQWYITRQLEQSGVGAQKR